MKKSNFQSSDYEIIDDFLNLEECEELLNLIFTYKKHHRVPEIYRPMKPKSLRYSVIDGEQIKKHLLKIWFLQNRVYELVRKITKTKLVLLSNTRASVNINIMRRKYSEYRWHYDRCMVTAMLYLTNVEGGEIEMYPNYRIHLKNKNFFRAQRMFDRFLQMKFVRNGLRKKILIKPQSGRLVIIKGNRCLHSVRALQGERERINIIWAYDSPNAQFSMENGLDSYLYTKEKQISSDPNYN